MGTEEAAGFAAAGPGVGEALPGTGNGAAGSGMDSPADADEPSSSRHTAGPIRQPVPLIVSVGCPARSNVHR